MNVFDDALPLNLLAPVLSEIAERGFHYGWHSSKGIPFSHWNQVFGNSKRQRKDVAEVIPAAMQVLWDYLEKTYLHGMTLIRCYANAYTYGTDGYPHRDSADPKDMTIVCYLNPGWQVEWAGETTTFDAAGEVEHAVLPKFRRIVVFPGAQLHVGRGVSRACPVARTILVFKARCA